MNEAKHKEYSNGEITVIWKPEICIHSGNCVKNSPSVFRPQERPWISIEAASSEEIVSTVEKCPSGALSYRAENQKFTEPKIQASDSKTKIEAIKDGPLIIYGEIDFKNSDGSTENLTAATTALCRCGASSSKPFCDGSHSSVNFKG